MLDKIDCHSSLLGLHVTSAVVPATVVVVGLGVVAVVRVVVVVLGVVMVCGGVVPSHLVSSSSQSISPSQTHQRGIQRPSEHPN